MAKVVEILPDLDAIAQRASDILDTQLQAAIAERGQFTIALAGGSTPKLLYQKLAQRSLPLEQIHLFWGDERYVSPDHPDSNQRMVREAWLNHVAMSRENIHPMPTSAQSLEVDVQTYEAELQSFFKMPQGEMPSFDLILLGMGDDGHTASLFPHTPALNVCDRLVTAGIKSGEPRLTLTIPVINQARCVLFMLAGSSKGEALTKVMGSDADPNQYPARFIQPSGTCYWLLDTALGSVISGVR